MSSATLERIQGLLPYESSPTPCHHETAGVVATTSTRLARNDQKAASALSLDLAGKIVTVLDCGIEDLLVIAED